MDEYVKEHASTLGMSITVSFEDEEVLSS